MKVISYGGGFESNFNECFFTSKLGVSPEKVVVREFKNEFGGKVTVGITKEALDIIGQVYEISLTSGIDVKTVIKTLIEDAI